jgi:hypothetical protein
MKSNKQVNNVPDINIETLSLYELCRWSALEEAVNIIGDKCDDRNIDFNSVELKPLDILKYIDNATDKIYEKVTATAGIDYIKQ